MIVWQSRYDKVVRELKATIQAAEHLARQLAIAKNSYNRVFRKYQEANDEIAQLSNRKGNNSGFTQEELRAMRRMMHPDRNGGSETATRITQKLNGMIK